MALAGFFLDRANVRNTQICDINTLPDYLQLSGFFDLSPDGTLACVSNLSSGQVDIYDLLKGLDTQVPVRSHGKATDSNRNCPLNIAFVDQGQEVVCGSVDGAVSVHDVASAAITQTLVHEGESGTCMIGRIIYTFEGELVRAVAVSGHCLPPWLHFSQ